MTVRDQAVLLVCRAGLYRPVRNAYHRVFQREQWAARARQRRLLRGFVHPGCLTFDVGANNGRYSEALLELGSTPVAVEPNLELAAAIRRRYSRVTVEPVAVGSHAGEAVLHLGVFDGHSTISERFLLESASGAKWSGTVTVPVVTLDDLISRHGTPAFIKVDVEGLELEVLRGLTQRVPAIAIEYHASMLDIAEQCLSRLQQLGMTSFRVAKAEGQGWATARIAAPQVLNHIQSETPSAYGDVFAWSSP